MRIIKVSNTFFGDCQAKQTEQELLFNKSGRPCVLLKLKYKKNILKFAVPFHSNIPSYIPTNEYFPLPPNNNTQPGNSHGIHYIKIFPVSDKYINKYRINNNVFWQKIKALISLPNNERIIVNACQEYLSAYERTPNINGILSWL